jgi:hypothetical protein
MMLNEIFKSKYCWLVIFVSAILGYFLVIKKLTSFTSFWSIFLSVFYIILFSISNSCLIRLIKDRVKNNIKAGTNSLLSIIGSILGLGAIQLCTVSGTCSVTLFTSLIFTVFPTSIGMLFINNGIWILLFSNILLLYSLFKMNCFKKQRIPIP